MASHAYYLDGGGRRVCVWAVGDFRGREGVSSTSPRAPEDCTQDLPWHRENRETICADIKRLPHCPWGTYRSELSENSEPAKPTVNGDVRDTFSLLHICLGQRGLRGVSSCAQSALILRHESVGWCVTMCTANVTNCPGNVAFSDTRLEKHTTSHECPGRWLCVITGAWRSL